MLFVGLDGLAKFAEALDEPIRRWTGGFAGHPLEHLLAAAALAALVPWLGTSLRESTPAPGPPVRRGGS